MLREPGEIEKKKIQHKRGVARDPHSKYTVLFGAPAVFLLGNTAKSAFFDRVFDPDNAYTVCEYVAGCGGGRGERMGPCSLF
jgi:hypothetical protein